MMKGRACKVCSLPTELTVQVDSLLEKGKPLREISGLVSLTGHGVSFMSVARHRKHSRPGDTARQLAFERELDVLHDVLQGRLDMIHDGLLRGIVLRRRRRKP